MVVRVSGVLRRTVAGGNGPFDKDVIFTESQMGGRVGVITGTPEIPPLLLRPSPPYLFAVNKTNNSVYDGLLPFAFSHPPPRFPRSYWQTLYLTACCKNKIQLLPGYCHLLVFQYRNERLKDNTETGYEA